MIRCAEEDKKYPGLLHDDGNAEECARQEKQAELLFFKSVEQQERPSQGRQYHEMSCMGRKAEYRRTE